jgi:hypothetical protein
VEPEEVSQPISLESAPPQPILNIDTGISPPQPPNEEVAQSRAYKAHMGLGDIVKQDYDEIYRNIAGGKESVLRENAALNITAGAMEVRQKAIIDLAANKGSALTLNDIASLTPPEVRPGGVIEQTYARAYVNATKEAAARIPDNILTDAEINNPEAVKAYFDKGSDILSNKEYAVTKAENLKAELDKIPQYNFKDFLGITHRSPTDLDFKQLLSLGFYEGYVLRKNLNTDSVDFLGNILDNKAMELLKLPPDQFQSEMDRLTNAISSYDKDLAYKFVQSVVGMSTSDKFLDSALEVLNVATLGLVAPKGQIRNTRAAPIDRGGLAPGPDGVYRPRGGPSPAPGGGSTSVVVNGVERPDLHPQARLESDDLGRGAMSVQEVLRGSPVPPETQVQQMAKVITDVLQSSASPKITKATIAEGAGDTREAAVQKAIVSTTQPDPLRDATDTLFSLHRTRTDLIRNAPGDLSREQHTRFLSAADGYENRAVNVLTESVRVMRTPVLAEQGYRDILDNIGSLFPGKQNTILNADARYEPYSNTTAIDVYIGNYDGNRFSSPELARNHAITNGYPIQIEGQVPKRVYVPAALFFTKDAETGETIPSRTAVSVKDGKVKVTTYQPEVLLNKKGQPIGYSDNKFVEGDVEPSLVPHPGHIGIDTETGKFVAEQTARIEQQGLGFHLVVTIPLNEVKTRIRDALIIEDKAKSISNKDTGEITKIGNSIIGLVRNPYDTLSVVENENRAKTVFGQTRFLEFVQQEIAPVEKLYRDDLITHRPVTYLKGVGRTPAKDFTRALVFAQTAEDPVTKLPGYYMQTPQEIQNHWLANYNRPASELEQSAYLAITRLDHFDHVLRSIMSYRNKARLGVMQMQFSTNKDGENTDSPWFEAQLLNKVPAIGDDVMLIVSSDGSEKYWHNMSPDNQEAFRELVDHGRFTGGQIYNPEARPISRIDSDGNTLRIRYIFSNNMKVKPITYDQVGYRGGGHWEYDYDHSVKQAIIRPQKVSSRFEHIYEGDSTFGFVTSRAQGEDFAKHMNEIARLIRARDAKGVKAYAKDHFDIEFKKLYAGFRPSKNPVTGEIQPPRFSTDPRQEFRVVPKGKTIADLDNELSNKFSKTDSAGTITNTFVDGTKHGSLARNFQVAYTQPRDSYALNEFFNKGSGAKPFYEFRPASLTDPITALTRAMERAVSSIYMDDMKITAAEHWIQENIDLFDISEKNPIAMVRSSPFWYFREGKLKNNPDTALRRINAETNRYKIKDFLGEPSKIDTVMHGLRQSMSDAIYAAEVSRSIAAVSNKAPTLGKVIKAPLLAPEWLLDRVSTPVDFLRGMTFHTTLGLLNWTQLTAQSMAYATIFALADVDHAAAGSFGALLHQWSRINKKPNVVSAMDTKATMFGWRPGEFTEAMKFLDRSGFGVIGNTISLDNGMHKKNFFISDGGRFLRSSQIFFDLANQNVRYGAYYTAFYEFRKKNPFKKITQVEEGQILYRANYLNSLMSRDANTILNKGLVGVPMMFFDYIKKVGDVFWSRNLAPTFAGRMKVRAKMFLINSMLFGMVTSTGLTLIPGGDWMRQKALENGYVPGKNMITTLVFEGPLSMVGAAITGGGDMAKGTYYDFNNRFGPGGYQIIRDLLEADVPFWKILTGAVGSKIGDTLSRLSPFTQAMYSQLQSDPNKKVFKLTMDDWYQAPDVINSWKMGRRMIYAEAFGKWLDSHGRPVNDIGKIDAMFRTLSGLRDVVEDDMYLRNKINKERQQNYLRAINDFEHYAYLGQQDALNGNRDQAIKHMTNAFFQLESAMVPLEMQAKAIQRLATMNRGTLAKNLDRFYLSLIPTDKRQIYDEAYQQLHKREQ